MKTSPLAGPAVRVGVGLLLCGACFQAGRRYQALSASAAESEAAAGEVAEPKTPSLPAAAAATSAPGEPAGHGGEIITPLNVRDPSSLVMGLSHHYDACPPPPQPAPRAAPRESKPRDLPEGRLLELLKKDGKDSSAPKSY